MKWVEALGYSAAAFLLGIGWLLIFCLFFGGSPHSPQFDVPLFGFTSLSTAWALRWAFCGKQIALTFYVGMASGIVGAVLLVPIWALLSLNPEVLTTIYIVPIWLLLFGWFWVLPFGLAYAMILRGVGHLLKKTAGSRMRLEANEKQ